MKKFLVSLFVIAGGILGVGFRILPQGPSPLFPQPPQLFLAQEVSQKDFSPPIEALPSPTLSSLDSQWKAKRLFLTSA